MENQKNTGEKQNDNIINRPTLVQTSEIGKVGEIVCGDSTTIVKAMYSDKVYGWGRGHSIERNLDISRFKPKELSSIETLHRFLIPTLQEVFSRPNAQLSQNMATKNKADQSEESRESILSNLHIDLPQKQDG